MPLAETTQTGGQRRQLAAAFANQENVNTRQIKKSPRGLPLQVQGRAAARVFHGRSRDAQLARAFVRRQSYDVATMHTQALCQPSSQHGLAAKQSLTDAPFIPLA